MFDAVEIKRRAGIRQLNEGKESKLFFKAAADLLRLIELDPNYLSPEEQDHLEGFATQLANAVSRNRARG